MTKKKNKYRKQKRKQMLQLFHYFIRKINNLVNLSMALRKNSYD